MSSFANDKRKPLLHVLVTDGSTNRDVDNRLHNVDIPTRTSENVVSLQSQIKALKISLPSLENHENQGERRHLVPHPGINNSYNVPNQYFHGGSCPTTEIHSTGFTPLYTTAGPTYPHGLMYPPQYGMGGYPYEANPLPSFSPGYPPHDVAGFDGQHINRFYEQIGFPPSFSDPRLQFQLSFGDSFSVPGQLDPLTLKGDIFRPQHHIRGTEHFGKSFSPVWPGSPIGVNNFPGEKSDVSSPNSCRSAGFYSSWQGQRGNDNINHQKPYSFLEELKSGKGRRFELSDITGHVVDFSVDQHGSRFIQQKLENCSVEDKAFVFEEIVPHACQLMTDVFGNYVIQKLFMYGTLDQRRDLAKTLSGQILPLSLQMYGCRVIQKAFDVIELDQKIELIYELDGHVMKCVRDQNGNHVIQKCIECVPSERIGFIISAFRGQVASLSMHPYGCRVVQRVLEHCTDESQSQFIVDEILESVCTLAQDQYGNYVTQHILEKGKQEERSQIIKKLTGQVVKMSQHKFASNVIEKCLEYGDAASREILIAEVVGQTDGSDNLLVMMKDQYANYVVQKILEKCADSQREALLDRVKVHLNGLKKYTYGKHIVARFEQLFGEIQVSTS